MAQFRDILRQLRMASNLSQKQMAERLGITDSAISQYETGRRTPPYETMESIADYFNVDMAYLLGKSDIPRVVSFDEHGRKTSCCNYSQFLAAGKPPTDDELQLLQKLRSLSVRDRMIATSIIDQLFSTSPQDMPELPD